MLRLLSVAALLASGAAADASHNNQRILEREQASMSAEVEIDADGSVKQTGKKTKSKVFVDFDSSTQKAKSVNVGGETVALKSEKQLLDTEGRLKPEVHDKIMAIARAKKLDIDISQLETQIKTGFSACDIPMLGGYFDSDCELSL